jgi:CRP-like cAMP-binding protein
MSVGEQSLILIASDGLRTCLLEAGTKRQFPATDNLFREDGDNAGVFLVVKGKVCLSMQGLPRLDRVFGKGSLLGLPSTFTGQPYSLTATAVTAADVVHVPREEFVHLMRERPELCREATEMLGREISFIQSALAERQRQTASGRTSGGNVALG